MSSVRKDLRPVRSFIKRIRIHIEKLRKYSIGDPYIADKYIKELEGFRFQSQEILEKLNGHDRVKEQQEELIRAMNDFEQAIEECR